MLRNQEYGIIAVNGGCAVTVGVSDALEIFIVQ
jgi:hypothetical protein